MLSTEMRPVLSFGSETLVMRFPWELNLRLDTTAICEVPSGTSLAFRIFLFLKNILVVKSSHDLVPFFLYLNVP